MIGISVAISGMISLPAYELLFDLAPPRGSDAVHFGYHCGYNEEYAFDRDV
jgi:hypothetical protein